MSYGPRSRPALHKNLSEVLIPSVLTRYDTPDLLIATHPRPVVLVNPANAMGQPEREANVREALRRALDADKTLRTPERHPHRAPRLRRPRPDRIAHPGRSPRPRPNLHPTIRASPGLLPGSARPLLGPPPRPASRPRPGLGPGAGPAQSRATPGLVPASARPGPNIRGTSRGHHDHHAPRRARWTSNRRGGQRARRSRALGVTYGVHPGQPHASRRTPGPRPRTRFASSRPGEIVVPVTVGGLGPFRFLLDTGSTHTAVTDRLATAVDAVPVARTVMRAAAGSVGCLVVALPTVVVDGVSADGLTATALPQSAAAALGPGVDGVLGQDFLSRFAFTIDYRRSQIVWHDADYVAPGTRLDAGARPGSLAGRAAAARDGAGDRADAAPVRSRLRRRHARAVRRAPRRLPDHGVAGAARPRWDR